MKCLLILPAWNVSDIFPSELGTSVFHRWEPLGLLYVAGSLLQAGHEVKLIDGGFCTHEAVLADFCKFQPDWVGIYANCPLWTKCMRTARDIRQLDPHVFISIGGPAAIGWRDACLRECEAIDCVHTGEGESSACQVVRAVETKGDLKDILGICYRGPDGEIFVNPDAPPVEDLDALPFPPRHLLGDFRKYRPNLGTFRRAPVAIIMSSRGCSHGKCIFCFRPASGGVRFRSPANVVDEMEECVCRHGAREIKFIDDNFTADAQRVFDICEEIRRRGLKVPWFVSSRVDCVTREMLASMKKAGCWAILYGAESGVQKNLDALNKGATVEQIRRAVRWAKEVGLHVSTPFIFGIPGETFEEGLRTIDFAIQLDSDMVNFHTLAPFPGAELYDNVAKYGTMTSVTDELHFETAPFTPYTMTRQQVLRLKQLAYRRFYGRLRYGLKAIFNIRTGYDLLAVLHGIRALVVMLFVKNIFHGQRRDVQ